MAVGGRRRYGVADKSARGDAIAEALRASPSRPEVFVFSDVGQPSLAEPGRFRQCKTDVPEEIIPLAEQATLDLMVIGPEEPLKTHVVDRLLQAGIKCVGPTSDLARLETSKSFTRALLKDCDPDANPEHRIFRRGDEREILQYLERLGEFVVKPDGLRGGKGVRVSGDHFHTTGEALRYASEQLREGPVVVEEKLEGEEFSFQSFCDGETLIHTIPVQDHKRALIGDKGLNTGGMGSYSCENRLLPFLTADDVRKAAETNERVVAALMNKVGQPYRGVIYGGYMLTSKGLRVVEFNARFGDPEVMNVLPIMEGDFAELCWAIADGTLHHARISFQKKATVCKYVVPFGYPNPSKDVEGTEVDLSELEALTAADARLRFFRGAMEEDDHGRLHLTRSRTVACVGIGDTLGEAEQVAERGASAVRGKVTHRRDVGTEELIRKRVNHMRRLRVSIGPHNTAPQRATG